jgi:hypothetical protein
MERSSVASEADDTTFDGSVEGELKELSVAVSVVVLE